MNSSPKSIKNYLKKFDDIQYVDGYLCLNDKQEILENCGFVGVTNIANIDCTLNAVQAIPVLEGLLGEDFAEQTVIYFVHVDRDYYFDIHLFHDIVGNWILFIDSTSSAKEMQRKQQIRHDDILKNDNCRSAN